MWTSAARLAAASARKKISGGGGSSSSSHWLFMRRSSSLAAAAADVWKKKGVEGMKSGSESEMELELKKEKSLYLCFIEMSRCGAEDYANQVVRPIRLNSDDEEEEEEEKEECLREAAYKRSKVNKAWSLCIRFGAQIVFPSGTDCRISHLNWIDTSTRPIKFPNSSSSKTKFKSFSSPKVDPLLGELNGKLYCIDAGPYLRDPKLRPFEVLDPGNDLEWRPLDPPPFIDGFKIKDFDISFLEGSNKILGWQCEKAGVYCFDTTKPEIGWIESSFSLGNTLPFLEYLRPPIFIRNHHPKIGAYHLMFIYDPINSPLLVTPFFMSDNCDSFHRIEDKPLQLPELCLEYNDFTDYGFDYKPIISTDFEFVHLGAQKVCLVLNKFFPHDHDHDRLRNTGILLLITFEYEIITTVMFSKPTIEIQTRLLRTRRFRYRSRQLRKPNGTMTNTVRMNGAFLL